MTEDEQRRFLHEPVGTARPDLTCDLWGTNTVVDVNDGERASRAVVTVYDEAEIRASVTPFSRRGDAAVSRDGGTRCGVVSLSDPLLVGRLHEPPR